VEGVAIHSRGVELALIPYVTTSSLQQQEMYNRSIFFFALGKKTSHLKATSSMPQGAITF